MGDSGTTGHGRSSQNGSTPPKDQNRGARKRHTPGSTNGSLSSKSHDQTAANQHQPSWLENLWHYTLVPLVFFPLMPNLIMTIWYTVVFCDGSYLKFLSELQEHGILSVYMGIWSKVSICSKFSCMVILGYAAWALLLQVTLPGPRAEGPVTPKGNVPVYKDNGFACFVVTILAFTIFTAILKHFGMTPTVVYDHFGDIIATQNIFSLIFCLFLYIKGIISPSSSDCGSSGNFIFDYYWGTELYPRVFGVDIKVFTNCRFGMTVWPLLCLIFALKSYELYGFVDSIWVSTLLQMAYFTKFFWWEAGYMGTIDIMVDRAGFYLCWGCLVFVGGFYTSPSLYLTTHPVHLGVVLSTGIITLGLASIAVNYIADRQKQDCRRTNGNCLIWGKKPETIRARYQLETGEVRESLLLVSGWWGVARHFHYLPELVLAFCWTLPGLFHNYLPYTYVSFLSILLIHRTFRDDEKCGMKYTKHWEDYCRRVPYKMIPGLF